MATLSSYSSLRDSIECIRDGIYLTDLCEPALVAICYQAEHSLLRVSIARVASKDHATS